MFDDEETSDEQDANQFYGGTADPENVDYDRNVGENNVSKIIFSEVDRKNTISKYFESIFEVDGVEVETIDFEVFLEELEDAKAIIYEINDDAAEWKRVNRVGRQIAGNYFGNELNIGREANRTLEVQSEDETCGYVLEMFDFLEEGESPIEEGDKDNAAWLAEVQIIRSEIANRSTADDIDYVITYRGLNPEELNTERNIGNDENEGPLLGSTEFVGFDFTAPPGERENPEYDDPEALNLPRESLNPTKSTEEME